MPWTSTIVAATLLLLVALYVFGIPSDLKRVLERKALETMGENKASYLVKDAIGKLPENDRLQTGELKRGLNDLGGNALKNPLGAFAGEAADEGTRDFTGR